MSRQIAWTDPLSCQSTLAARYATIEGGHGMATAGLILGYVGLVVGMALFVAFLASLPSWRRGSMALSTVRDCERHSPRQA
jgi:hypothetical protein